MPAVARALGSRPALLVLLTTAAAAFTSVRASAVAAQRAMAGQLPQISVATVSDTHGIHRREPMILHVPDGEVLLFAGDAGVRGAREWAAFTDWLAALPHRHKVMTYGNMDSYGAASDPSVPGVEILVDRIADVAGYRVFGSPYTPKFFGAFQLESEVAADEHWARVLPPDSDVDILLTHGPPYGIADQSGGRHVGDKALLRAFQALKRPPLLWVVGHIHESYGQYTVKHVASGTDVLLINAASYYLTRGHPDAAPRLVALPSKTVTQPTLERGGARARELSEADGAAEEGVWRRPADPIVL